MANDIAAQHPTSLTIRRTYRANPEKVWRAWTEPEALKRWMAPNPAFTTPVAEVDLRVGGSYRLLMISPDGEDHEVSGVYRDVEPGKKLVYTWAWKKTPERESVITLELRAAGEGTELTLIHEKFHDTEERDHHHQGWEACLTQLLGYVDSAAAAIR